MKMTKKHLTLYTILLCGILAAVGCGSDTTDSAVTTEAAAATTTAETELTDGLPDTDMQGFEFKIKHFDGSWLSWAETIMDAETTTGDILEDAIYTRNRDIEERFNCKIIVEGANSINASDMQTVAMSGDTTYDVYFNYDIWITSALQYLLPWENLPHINLNAEWWNPDATEVFRIGGKTYSAAGNYSLSVLSRAGGYEFNKKLLSDLDGGDIYQMVRDKKWTLDAMFSLAKLSTSDLDGDGQMGDNDRYGISGSWKETLNRMILGAGIKYVEQDDNGYPVFTLPTDQNAIDKLMHLYDAIMDMNVYYAAVASNIDANGSKGDFKAGGVLFLVSNLFMLEGHRDYDIDIGFVPCPMYDENQDRYYAPSFGAEVSVLPITLPEERYENVGMLLEALNFKSHYEVLPMYKEVVLKTKSARDDDSSDMIDIMFKSVSFDFGINAWQNQLSSPLIQGVYSNRSGNVASTLTKLQKSVDQEIKKLIENVEAE